MYLWRFAATRQWFSRTAFRSPLCPEPFPPRTRPWKGSQIVAVSLSNPPTDPPDSTCFFPPPKRYSWPRSSSFVWSWPATRRRQQLHQPGGHAQHLLHAAATARALAVSNSSGCSSGCRGRSGCSRRAGVTSVFGSWLVGCSLKLHLCRHHVQFNAIQCVWHAVLYSMQNPITVQTASHLSALA